MSRVEALCWCAAALFLMVYGDGRASLPLAIINLDAKGSLYIGSVLSVIIAIIFFFVAVWLPYGRRDFRDWEVAAPAAIPAASACGALAGLAWVSLSGSPELNHAGRLGAAHTSAWAGRP